MAITNQTREVSLTTEALNLTATSGISPSGYWYYYVPGNSNNDIVTAAIKPYRWDTTLTITGSASNLAITATMPLITESWEGANTKYHGGSIEWIGAGVNDITNTIEDDAFFFPHLDSLSPTNEDDAFYWDRAYLAQSASEWEYYEYHKHLPLFYPSYENGRQVFSARGFIDPDDKAYGYMISSRVTVMSTNYSSIVARVHTPSIGGAHNSHNDVNLPTVSAKNYLPGGIIKGNSNRFHAFYISANSTTWDVFTRTYTQTSLSFTAEVNFGSFDLADPDFTPASNIQSRYPLRASAGTAYSTRIYFPVIFNNTTSGFDLKIWSLNSLDTIAGGSLIQYTLATGVTVRPDCHLKVFNDKLYALYTDVANGGIRLQSFNITTGSWTDEGQVLTNDNTKYVRVHGFEYNSQDTKFYALLSGTSAGVGSTYTGPGLYSFEITGSFPGYKHLDYDKDTNSFVNRAALANGHVRYDKVNASLTKYTNAEPQGIPSDVGILEYTVASPKFINYKESILGGEEYYYQGINLVDNRKMFVGRIVGNEGNFGTGTSGDLLVSLFNDVDADPHHFVWGGAGDDYITGAYQSPSNPKKIWLTGYTKSSLVDNKDIKVHGFCRSFADGANLMQFVDLVTDTDGNIYAVGNHDSGYIFLMKFDANYNLLWQYSYDGGAGGTDLAYGICIDSSKQNIYICGSTSNVGQGSTDALVIKASASTGTKVYCKTYGTASAQYASSITSLTVSSVEKILFSVVTGTTTTFTITDTSGTVETQNDVTSLVVKRVRPDTGNPNVGRFVFAGNDGAGTTTGVFGVGDIDATPMMIWIRSYSDGSTASGFNDIRAIDADDYVVVGKISTAGLALKVNVTSGPTVTKTWARKINTSEFNSVVLNATGEIFIAGYTTTSGIALMGNDEGLLVKLNSDGTVAWQNAFGHDMDENLTSIVLDVTGENIISCGWSESHSSGRDALIFRSWMGGFGTGTYHLEGAPGTPYYYLKTTLGTSSDTNSLSTISVPSNSAGSLTTATSTNSFAQTDSGFLSRVFDGSFGPSGLFTFWLGTFDLDKAQEYLNSSTHRTNMANGVRFDYTNFPFTFYQVATVGDGTADDGNIFGYDIIEASDGMVFAIGQTSGDVSKTNLGLSGVYDYILFEFDPDTGQFEYYQNGTSLDEETYALCELADGRIAYTGRTSGSLGGTNQGGYDIFLGIFDRNTEISDYYSTGSGLDDKGVNIHDLGGNKLAITFSSYGAVGPTNFGTEDIGVIEFNYSTDTWGTAYQTGSATSEFFEQNGKPSVLLGDGRIAICCSSTGNFGDDNFTYGFLDLCVGILDRAANTWTKYQIGSGASDFASSVDAVGDRLLITGYSRATFADKEVNGIAVEFDVVNSVGAKSAVE